MKNNSGKKRSGSRSNNQGSEKQTSQGGSNRQSRSRSGSMSNNNGSRSNGK